MRTNSWLRSSILVISVLVLAFTWTRECRAQVDPREVLKAVVYQLQTGTPNPTWYGTQLWQTIAMQTQNTGRYHDLVQLGTVIDVTIAYQMQLPGGPLYSMVARHQNGNSAWYLGISDFTRRIEVGSFSVGSAPILPHPTPNQSTSNPNPPPNLPPNPLPSTASEACKQFPNLC
jgi:hypothetical protein